MENNTDKGGVNKRKTIGLVSAIGLGVSSIIGSGWLFAPYKAAAVAGPASLLAWVLGGFLICLLGLCFAEIATLFPRRGLSAIIPVISHNKYFAFPFAIANWLGIVAVIALEADATTQYLINLAPSLEPYLFYNGHLSSMGVMLSALLVVIFLIVNYWGASTLVKANNIFAIFKVIIPVGVIIAIFATAFHPSNFTFVHHELIPYGFSSIFVCLLTTGIIVAFNGFQTVISFASEIKNPQRIIPLSLVISVLFCLLIYLLLQTAFIGAIPQQLLQVGWTKLQFTAPIVQLLGLLGLGMLSTVIYFGSTMAPSGTAIAFTGTASRMFTAMSRNGHMPKYFDKVHPVYRISRPSLILNTVLAVMFLMLFRSWSSLAQVLSLFHIISYLPVPIAIWVFRSKIDKQHYSFKLPFGKAIALSLFVFFTYLFTLSALNIAMELMAFFAFFLTVFIVINAKSINHLSRIFGKVWPMLVYFIALIALTLLSPDHSHLLTNDQFALVVIVSSLGLFKCLTLTKKEVFDLGDKTLDLYEAEAADMVHH